MNRNNSINVQTHRYIYIYIKRIAINEDKYIYNKEKICEQKKKYIIINFVSVCFM